MDDDRASGEKDCVVVRASGGGVVWWAGFGGCGGFVLLAGEAVAVSREAQGSPPGKDVLRHRSASRLTATSASAREPAKSATPRLVGSGQNKTGLEKRFADARALRPADRVWCAYYITRVTI